MDINERSQILEERMDSSLTIRIIVSCLREIKNYNTFKIKEETIEKFLKKNYPYLKKVDINGINKMICIWIEQYEYSNKKAIQRPSTMGINPFSFGIRESAILDIIKMIEENETDYLKSINMIYSEYS